jgi:Arc/MetJ-type ribon-helix-helix transcriptional regulator
MWIHCIGRIYLIKREGQRMADDLRRTIQRSVRLNQQEADQFDGLLGFRGLWEWSDLVRAGLQLLLKQELEDLAALGETGAAKRRQTKRKGKEQ